MNAVHAALSQICSCGWNITPQDTHVRYYRDAHCPVHGTDAMAQKRQKLIRDREGAALAVKTLHTEAITWIRRHRNAKRRLRDLNQQLKELS
jgi:hypothetical protein